ncbi:MULTISPECIES: HAL/PAL/TAL family ammonia-lyase [Rhizobium/Agrobacterium group]|uniref:Phenylalanine/histidine ammonia-lyase n=1 Tax=Agrobacterium tomkonis CFBP 6623 TaxID=1183432 RepID=A0A1S7RRC6_9HYPH|nr:MULTISPECIES: aromatic amino acid ammonia-lyase [Rhizobium/Agrobacterium group]KRA55465.1 phenylalanine ammonia-lyase [Rhizobium sp. Root651]QCL91771.1 aromatic amino acid lyase [Agrobacterium tumefaciens]TKT59083.1 aromatic amino acid lyase [Agrobacterium sp. LC34]CUX55833.1 Phenylalanine/histidine ammonia-lyase [Agrobacterium tomkonis CFBP 6623]
MSVKNGTIHRLSIVTAFAIAGLAASNARAEHWSIDGQNLTVEQVVGLARDDSAKITLTESADKRIAEGFDLVMEAALQGKAVYGLTVGVGWNKDRPVFAMKDGKRVLDDDLLKLSRAFNSTSLRAHGAGVGEPMAVEAVRAGMAIRLNQIATGRTGVQSAVAEMYRQFLEQGITPVVPSRGSVGEADITLASHIGLAMVGEGEVFMKGNRIPAARALTDAGIAPLEPVGKDFLSILSTNALTAGQAALLAHDTAGYLEKEAIVFGLALEGFNGNVAPFLAATNELRPFAENTSGALMVRSALDGSYLWSPAKDRALQDPLSYRTMAYVLGGAEIATQDLTKALEIQINHSDDNPGVVAGASDDKVSGQVSQYFIEGEISGAIYPSAGFEMLPVASRVETLNTALVRLSQAITMQTIRFENPDMTHLSRFLAAETNQGHAFGAIQKPLVALLAENQQIGAQAPVGSIAMAGNIEDLDSHAPLSVTNLGRILDNLYWMSSIQLLHAAQAVDLRKPGQLGAGTKALFENYRRSVPFVAVDRIYTNDFSTGYRFLKAR